MFSWLWCLIVGHDFECLGESKMQGELWTVYDYSCKRCGHFANSTLG
jgi:hypothetical protein